MRAWLYYRLSRDEDQEMNSLHNQRQILVDYAEQHGYEIVGESFDDNVTGMTFAVRESVKLKMLLKAAWLIPYLLKTCQDLADIEHRRHYLLITSVKTM